MNNNFTEKQWYILYTNPRVEKKLSVYLKKYKIENYLPLLRLKKRWSDRFKFVETPLLTSYLFVKIEFFREKPNVLILPGAHHFVYLNGMPVTVKDQDIENIKIMIQNYPDQIQIKKEETLVPGKTVKIHYGPFKGYEGTIIRLKNQAKLVVKLPAVGNITAEVPVDDLGLEELHV